MYIASFLYNVFPVSYMSSEVLPKVNKLPTGGSSIWYRVQCIQLEKPHKDWNKDRNLPTQQLIFGLYLLELEMNTALGPQPSTASAAWALQSEGASESTASPLRR